MNINKDNKVTTLSSIILVLLKELRLERNIHQAHLAEMCGKSPSSWNKIESGKSPLTMELFLKICNSMPIPPSNILATAERYANLFAQEGWAILSQQLNFNEDLLLQEIQKYYLSDSYKRKNQQRRWDNISILNTPYYDNNGLIIMNEVFLFILDQNFKNQELNYSTV
jgi:transcriptional regulator with XRE-family HTH domain